MAVDRIDYCGTVLYLDRAIPILHVLLNPVAIVIETSRLCDKRLVAHTYVAMV